MGLVLRVLSFKRLLAFMERMPRRRRDGPGRAGEPSLPRLTWLVEVAGRHAPVEPTCLKTALVLFWLLQRRGIATTLRIGVARRDGALVAHAWLERQGQVIAGLPGGEGYAPLVSSGTNTVER